MGSNRKYLKWLIVLVLLYFLFKRWHIQDRVVQVGTEFMQSASVLQWIAFASIILVIMGGGTILIVKIIEGKGERN